jgi:hypothetical protein
MHTDRAISMGFLAIEKYTQLSVRIGTSLLTAADLDSTFEYLWRLIGASDTDWEWYRYPLEASCDELLHTIRQLPYDISFHPINSFMLMGVRVVQLGSEPEMVSSNAN